MACNKSRDIGVSVKEMLPFKAAARHVSLYLTLLLLLLLSAIAAADAAGNDAISVSSYLSKPLMRRDVSALAALHDSIDEDDDSGHYHDNNNDDDDDDDDDDHDHEPHTDDENDKSDVKHVNALHSKRQLTNELKADRDFDFAAYVNDFNLQEEASIPEDIFDQRHAQNDVSDADMVDVGSKLQYAAADVAPVAVDNDDEHDAADDKDDGDDDDDDNDDESEAADIILESQRPTSRNFTVYLDGVTNASNNNNKGNTKKYRNKSNNNNKSNKVNYNYNYNYKFKNNKENLQVGNEEQSSAGATKFTSADDVRHFAVPAAVAVSVEVDAEKDTDEDVVGNADNVANKSFAYKKLKHMHEQQNQQNQKEQQQANANSQLKLKPDQEQQQQQQQLFDSIEILNERKFNKATVAQSTLEQVMEQPTVELQLPDEDENENENEDEAQAEAEAEAAAIADAVEIPGSSRVKLKESHRNNDAGIMAIGDIEDNFGNDEVLAENIKSTIDNDESAKMLAMTTMSALPMMTATIATATTTSTTTTTRPSTTTTKSSSSTISSGLVGSSYQQPQQQQQLIGRKHKRHGSSSISGTGTASNRYYDIGRVMAKAKDADDADKDNDNNDDDDDDDDDDETYETDVLANTNANAQLDDDLLNVGELHFYDGKKHAGKSQANYLDSSGSHFGHSTINETQQQQQQKRQQQHAPRFIDDEYAEEQQQSAPALRYQDATESPSAFERFKALRRSHRRNGHKAHKKRYKDYLRYSLSQASSTTQKPATTTTSSDGTDTQLLNRQQKHALKLLQEQHQPQQQKQQQQSHAAPIFALGLRQQQRPTLKPFYEGQINYYEQAAESSDVSMPSEQVNGHNIERMIATDNSNWYRRISPVLRNGIKTSDAAQSTQQQQPQQHHKPPHHGKHHHQYHQHHQHHQRQHQQQQLHHHHRVHHRQRQPNPYQRKPATAVSTHQSMARTTPPPQPLPPPSYKQRNPLQELGHQITEMEELERYYAKWPHLARVQFQVYDEHYRETHPELYTDYDEDYESAAELEEAQQEHGAEANLPPYIKKYNRRNKQLLNLLEGTLPPITQPPPLRAASWSSSLLQPGPHDSSSSSSSSSSGTAVVRLDDDYLKEKRRRYHNHRPQQTQLFEDLFAMQRSSTVAPPTTTSLSNPNQLPDEQLDISREHPVESNAALSAAVDFWQKEIEAKSNANQLNGSPQMSWQIENAGAKSMDSLEEASAPATTTKPAIPAAVPTTSITPKPALFKLPSYPAIADSFMATPRSRSRNSQFVSNVSGRGQAWRFTADAAIPPIYPLSSTTESHTLATAPGTQTGALNSFVYHRVMDASPRLVGAGISSRKQRLPFVAITDRRLETSKKLLAERHKDFEQNNHFPMP